MQYAHVLFLRIIFCDCSDITVMLPMKILFDAVGGETTMLSGSFMLIDHYILVECCNLNELVNKVVYKVVNN